MNKYYTPSIEEFHIGFEYEYFNEYTNSYVPEIVTIEDIVERPIFENIELNKKQHSLLRVKYLDKEDIESLGFKLSEGSDCDYINEHGDKLHVGTYYHHGDEGFTLWLTKIINKVEVKVLQWYHIKNKSELKVLLKQLGIL